MWVSPCRLFQRSRSPEPASPRVSRGVDDSVIFSPPDGVVLRRKNIKKFNTVAYRGDSRPNKWKRASINGHIYNFDVSTIKMYTELFLMSFCSFNFSCQRFCSVLFKWCFYSLQCISFYEYQFYILYSPN